jgi:hypothetical protein
LSVLLLKQENDNPRAHEEVINGKSRGLRACPSRGVAEDRAFSKRAGWSEGGRRFVGGLPIMARKQAPLLYFYEKNSELPTKSSLIDIHIWKKSKRKKAFLWF